MRRLRRSFVGQESMRKIERKSRNGFTPGLRLLRIRPTALLHDGKGPARRQVNDRHTSGLSFVEADHAIFGRTKIAHAGDVIARRRSGGDERKIRRTVGKHSGRGEYVAALA